MFAHVGFGQQLSHLSPDGLGSGARLAPGDAREFLACAPQQCLASGGFAGGTVRIAAQAIAVAGVGRVGDFNDVVVVKDSG